MPEKSVPNPLAKPFHFTPTANHYRARAVNTYALHSLYLFKIKFPNPVTPIGRAKIAKPFKPFQAFEIMSEPNLS